MRNLDGKVAVVTGGTFGVGRGIASALAQYGARVFVTGRSAHDGVVNEEQITGIRCDHRVDTEVTAAFERVAREAGNIEVLVNDASLFADIFHVENDVLVPMPRAKRHDGDTASPVPREPAQAVATDALEINFYSTYLKGRRSKLTLRRLKTRLLR